MTRVRGVILSYYSLRKVCSSVTQKELACVTLTADGNVRLHGGCFGREVEAAACHVSPSYTL